MDTNNFIYSTAEKYQKTTILERLKALEADQQLKIGFVGMFSAGKTSLINALLNTHLPVNPNPTTKSICVIESDDNLEKNEYFLEIDGERKNVSFMDFTKIVSGKQTGVAIIRMPSQNEIPSGIIYVDTPGVDNYASEETDLTYRYLALLDAAVVCININEGTVRQSLLDFISVPELSSLSDRMFFVLTHSDTKTEDGIVAIKENVFQQLLKFGNENHKFSINSLKERIIAVNANEYDSAINVVNLIKLYILGNKNSIYEDRLQKQFKSVAKELATILGYDLENITYDIPDLEAKQNQVEKDIQNIEEELEKREKEFDRLKTDLYDMILSILKSHELEVTSAPSKEVMQQIFNNINQEIADSAQAKIRLISDKINVPIADGLGGDLLASLGRVDFTRNLAVTVTTSLLTAWIAPGAGAANLAEGAVGAAAQTAGKNTATTVAKEFAKNVVGNVAKNNKEPGTFGKIFRGIGQFIHDINPLEMVGDWVASEVKHNTYSSTIKTKAYQISDNIVYSLKDIFEDEIIRPLKNCYVEKSESLKQVINEKEKGFLDITNKRKELENIINKLNSL